MESGTLHHLFVHELKDLYSAENQILKALPRMAAAASSPALKRAFLSHLDETRTHIRRLEEIFGDMRFVASGSHGDGAEYLLSEGDHVIATEVAGPARDAGLIFCARRVEHYEMAGYGGAVALASAIGNHEALHHLRLTLEEEGRADRDLSTLSEFVIRADANPASHPDSTNPNPTETTMKSSPSVDACIDTCNKLLRGEMSAVETYQEAIRKFTDVPGVEVLRNIESEHRLSVADLQANIREMGGEPSADSGAWGEFAKAVQKTANLFGENSATASLLKGERHGEREYCEAIDDDDTLPECRVMMEATLLPRVRRHIAKLEESDRL